MNELNLKLGEVNNLLNEVFYLLPVEERDKVESIIDKVRDLER